MKFLFLYYSLIKKEKKVSGINLKSKNSVNKKVKKKTWNEFFTILFILSFFFFFFLLIYLIDAEGKSCFFTITFQLDVWYQNNKVLKPKKKEKKNNNDGKNKKKKQTFFSKFLMNILFGYKLV